MRKSPIDIFFVTFFFLFLYVNGNSQTRPDPYYDFYLIPQDMAMTLKASRNGLPIEIEKVDLFTNLTGSLVKCSYQFRNIGTKPVRRVEVAVINRQFFRLIASGMLGKYEDLVDLRNNKDGADLAPGTSIVIDQKLDRNRELPDAVVSQIRNQASKIKTKFIVALVITRIEFADGSVLSLSTDADDLESLFSGDFDTR